MGVVDRVKRKLVRSVRGVLSLQAQIDDLAFLAGQTAARQVCRTERLGYLWEAEFRVSSQWGEDGIIEWLVHQLPETPESFIEFGVENYRESNTRFLLQHRNWRGLVIDGSESNIEFIRRDRISWRHDLTAIASFITRENINSIISSAGFSGDIGVLSIDIDGVDYWVWEAIDCARPHIIIVEYNSAFGDLLPLSVPYSPDFTRQQAHNSNLYFGCSIRATRHLARKRGYTLVGTNRAGSNAFFVRDERASTILSRLDEVSDRPARVREARNPDGSLAFTPPAKRSEILAGLPIINVEQGTQMPLGQVPDLFSSRWKSLLQGGPEHA